eukprot:6201715-Pleurochrysis_carterae.AAC.1
MASAIFYAHIDSLLMQSGLMFFDLHASQSVYIDQAAPAKNDRVRFRYALHIVIYAFLSPTRRSTPKYLNPLPIPRGRGCTELPLQPLTRIHTLAKARAGGGRGHQQKLAFDPVISETSGIYKQH